MSAAVNLRPLNKVMHENDLLSLYFHSVNIWEHKNKSNKADNRCTPAPETRVHTLLNDTQ